MSGEKTIHPIGHIENDYKSKFGIPRQSRLTSVQSLIRLEPGYDSPDCFRELSGYSHIWLIWGFSENDSAGWNPTVRPPRLGGNKRVGVFASRSPFRPNGLGLSVVRLLDIEEDECGKISLSIQGADLMDRTPVYDIKPYMPSSDSIPYARGGYAASARDSHLHITCDPQLLERIPKEKRDPLMESLALDPRPRYQEDPDRVYGMSYGQFDIRFKVDKEELIIIDIVRCEPDH